MFIHSGDAPIDNKYDTTMNHTVESDMADSVALPLSFHPEASSRNNENVAMMDTAFTTNVPDKQGDANLYKRYTKSYGVEITTFNSRRISPTASLASTTLIFKSAAPLADYLSQTPDLPPAPQFIQLYLSEPLRPPGLRQSQKVEIPMTKVEEVWNDWKAAMWELRRPDALRLLVLNVERRNIQISLSQVGNLCQYLSTILGVKSGMRVKVCVEGCRDAAEQAYIERGIESRLQVDMPLLKDKTLLVDIEERVNQRQPAKDPPHFGSKNSKSIDPSSIDLQSLSLYSESMGSA